MNIFFLENENIQEQVKTCILPSCRSNSVQKHPEPAKYSETQALPNETWNTNDLAYNDAKHSTETYSNEKPEWPLDKRDEYPEKTLDVWTS